MIKQRLPLFLFGALSVALVTAVHASSDEAHRLLKKMSMAIKKLNYTGTFVYIHGRHLELMQITHLADQRGERERLYSLNGAPREILRTNDTLTCILPDSKSVVVEKSRPRKYIPAALLKLDPNLRKHYMFFVIGDDRIAGRKTRVISISPRDKYRYGYRLWLDKTNSMLLKSDVINEKGMPVEQLMFTNIVFKENISDAAVTPMTSGKGYKWYGKKQKAMRKPKKRMWQVKRLPAGFRESMFMEHGMPTSRMPVEHFVFTDGLSSVSVYIEKAQKGRKPMSGSSSMGAVNAWGGMVAGHQITVVGEVPHATVRMIGKSVVRMK